MAVAPGKLGLRCPDQGQFYVCEANSTEFVGCCLSDPCANGSGQCPEDELVPSSFSANQYAAIPAQDCEDAKGVSTFHNFHDVFGGVLHNIFDSTIQSVSGGTFIGAKCQARVCLTGINQGPGRGCCR
ncbi:hypothetical protein VD0002_g9323 [Verticillium dahliae]|nr:hypothetical protein VD0003_g9696 [Verticillium dahliae]PNH58199.1 hypothetical protein VD0002_g9323 [Verticillium dahliae]